MGLFKKTSNYVGAFVGYIVWSLIVLPRSNHRATASNISPGATHLVFFSEALGSLYIVFFFLSLVRKTSQPIERLVLVLTAIFFLVFLINIVNIYGYLSLGIPSSHAIAVCIVWVATFFVGIHTLQILLNRKRKDNSVR